MSGTHGWGMSRAVYRVGSVPWLGPAASRGDSALLTTFTYERPRPELR
jgi:hypothetical protein